MVVQMEIQIRTSQKFKPGAFAPIALGPR